MGSTHRTKLPVWPVVSMPAKNSAAISGSSCWSVRGCPVFGSLVFISRSAKLPGFSFVAFMCSRRSLMMSCSTESCTLMQLQRWRPAVYCSCGMSIACLVQPCSIRL